MAGPHVIGQPVRRLSVPFRTLYATTVKLVRARP
jgi:hypothetical protein